MSDWIEVGANKGKGKAKSVDKKKEKAAKLQKQKEEYLKERQQEDSKYRHQQQLLDKRIQEIESSEPKKPEKTVVHKKDQINLVSTTMFSQLEEMMMRKEKRRQDQLRLQEDAQKAEEDKKLRKRRTKSKKASLKAASENIDPQELSDKLEKVPSRYPTNEGMQLKVIAECMESYFTDITLGPQKAQKQKSFERKLEIPLDYLDEAVKSVLVKALKGYSYKTLAEFLVFLLKTLINLDQEKARVGQPLSGVGLKMLVQLIAQTYSGMLVTHTAQLKEALYGKKVNDATAELMFWTLAQTLTVNPIHALQLWCELLYPLLDESAVSDEICGNIMTYIELVLGNKTTLKDASLQPHTIEAILQQGPSAHESINDRLAHSYPALVAAVRNGAKNFPTMLQLLSREADNAQQLLKSLTSALRKDPQCYATWKSLYPKHLPASELLLSYINTNWDSLKTKLSKTELYQLVLSFMEFNRSTKKRVTGLQAACEVLHSRVKPSSAVGTLIKAVGFLAVVGAVAAGVLSTKCCEVAQASMGYLDPALCTTYLQLRC